MHCRSTAIPPTTPQVRTQGPPHPPQTHCSRALQCQNIAAHPGNHGGGVQYFVDGVLNRRAMYRFAVQQPKKNPLRVWQEGMRISRSHFLSRDEEHAAVVLEILCATPKPPRIPKPAPQPVPRRPLPPPASDQVTLTQYSRHRRSSLLPLAPAPKRPCPTPQYGSLLQRRASQSAPPLERPQFGSLLPAQPPPATSTDFGETFQFPALRQVCTGRLLHIGHSFISNLPLEARKCVLGLDRRVSDPDI